MYICNEFKKEILEAAEAMKNGEPLKDYMDQDSVDVLVLLVANHIKDTDNS